LRQIESVFVIGSHDSLKNAEWAGQNAKQNGLIRLD
jgi:hypothetical protein